jgi:hypothetical protein
MPSTSKYNIQTVQEIKNVLLPTLQQTTWYRFAKTADAALIYFVLKKKKTCMYD